MSQNLPLFVQFLLDPRPYPHEVSGVDLIQTHISYVFLAGDYVYKFKKPVDFGFLDFTTLAKRRFFCEQELILNRRLCPSIYLGLAAVTEDVDGLHLDGPGEAIEFGVKMRRMPEELMMGRLIAEGGLRPVMIDQIVELLVPFYEQAAGGEKIREFGRASAVGLNIRENFAQTRGFVGQGVLTEDQFRLIEEYSLAVLRDEDLFNRRIDQGRIRDCHGDLHSGNICISDSIYIFDCIEFNERLRYIDVASDVAFLTMDLDFHGFYELSKRFVQRFALASHDSGLFDVLNFYKCYRAYVRGKIDLLTAQEPEVDAATRAHCLVQARRYFALASEYARQQ